MNLSKVYSSGESFEPEDLVAGRLQEEAVFGSIITARLPAHDTQQRPAKSPLDSSQQFDTHADKDSPGQNFQAAPGITPPPEEAITRAATSSEELNSEPEINEEDFQLGKPEPETQVSPSPVQNQQESIPEPEIREPQQPPQPPPSPGIPVEEVQQLLAEAHETGIKEGLQQAEQDFGAATQSLLLICQQLDTIRETILRNSSSEMQNLVLAIAEKIIRKSVQEQSDTILLTVEDAIHKAVKSDELYIYVNPEDFEVVEQKSTRLMQGLSGLSNLAVKKDSNIERGGCRVESDNCTVDATILSQLEIISDQIKQQR